jgi:hypothetical protein
MVPTDKTRTRVRGWSFRPVYTSYVDLLGVFHYRMRYFGR